MGFLKKNPKTSTCQTKFASKPQKSTWPPTSSWMPECPSSLSPNSSTSESPEVASAHEETFNVMLRSKDVTLISADFEALSVFFNFEQIIVHVVVIAPDLRNVFLIFYAL